MTRLSALGPASEGRFSVAKSLSAAAREEGVLARWREHGIPSRALQQHPEGPLYRFYEGPPTANGRPGVHHVAARAFKDLFCRFHAMRGEAVPRAAGWDCHGIPVELEVERELGFTTKAEIEKYGVAEFNRRCRASVEAHVADFAALTERIGYWLDEESAYWTLSPTYIDSVWWSLAELYKRGLIYEEDRVVPYCPRCETTLSDHEVAQGYAEVDDPSIFVRFPILTGPLVGSDLLIWTTMPWTLVSATAAVIGPKIEYVVASGGRAANRPVVLAADRVGPVLGGDAQVVRGVTHGELLGARYRAPFNFVGPGSLDDPDGDPGAWRYVVASDFVRTDEGTGVVHTGAAFGVDDMRVARENGLPVVKPVDLRGRFDERVAPYAGMWVRDADEHIINDLRTAGLLLAAETTKHTFPFCWRCATPLLYYGKPSWYVATTHVRDQLIASNSAVDWHPASIGEGRYGNWLTNNVDWAISRERYWGTPLPFWRCEKCRYVHAVGSRRELGSLAGVDVDGLDPHRPFVDEITFDCPSCAAASAMQRIPEVLDAWYDSGAMPFAQHGYPHGADSVGRFKRHYPADLVAEGIDQTRGWFYSLQALGILLFGAHSYRRALCLGLVVDAEGRKMSKSAGNVLDPSSVIDSHGADPLRWLLLTQGSPWQARQVSTEALAAVERGTFATLWNTYHFFATYANLAEWSPSPGTPAASDVLDRWITTELDSVVDEVAAALDDYDAPRAGRRLAGFIDDLSDWYVRCSRERFSGRAHEAAGDAFAILHHCLLVLCRLLAPFIPFTADALYHALTPDAADVGRSVHLVAYPSTLTVPDERLRGAMAAARRLVSLGREARSRAGVPVRQPLSQATVTLPDDYRSALDEVGTVVASELNVKRVELATAATVAYELKPRFGVLGPRFGSETPRVADAIRRIDPSTAASALRNDGQLVVEVEGRTHTIDPEAVEVVEQPRHGWQLSSDGPYGVALDLTIDPELRHEGDMRELARMLNEERKRRGLSFAERGKGEVAVEYDPSGRLAGVLSVDLSELEAATRTVIAEVALAQKQPDWTELPWADGRAWIRITRSAEDDHVASGMREGGNTSV